MFSGFKQFFKMVLIWVIGVFHGSNTKTKLEREKQRTRGSASVDLEIPSLIRVL